jgi:MFS transporter, DHA1 family, multidrug resistance protein
VIAAGAVTFVLGGIVAGQVGARRSPRALLPVGIGLAIAGASATLVIGVLDLGLPALIAAILAVTSGTALTVPSATTIALARRPDIAGSAAAVVGVTRYALGAAAAPLVGLGGGLSAVPLAIVMLVCTLCALGAWLGMPRPVDETPRE